MGGWGEYAITFTANLRSHKIHYNLEGTFSFGKKMKSQVIDHWHTIVSDVTLVLGNHLRWMAESMQTRQKDRFGALELWII